MDNTSLITIKKLLDTAIRKGGIFKNVEQAIDAINAYTYLEKVCSEYDQAILAKEDRKDY